MTIDELIIETEAHIKEIKKIISYTSRTGARIKEKRYFEEVLKVLEAQKAKSITSCPNCENPNPHLYNGGKDGGHCEECDNKWS